MWQHKPIVVAFCGHKRHGKDTAAKLLVADYQFQHTSFADGLRATAAVALRVNPSFFTNDDTKEMIDPRTGKTRRYFLQYLGTEIGRNLYQNIWVDWWKEEIVARNFSRVVSSDLRFPNEEDAVRTFERSLIIRVKNPRLPASGDLHESEMHVDRIKADFDVLNDGTIDDLHAKVREIYKAKLVQWGVE